MVAARRADAPPRRAVTSNSVIAIWTPPMPSASEWCIFVISAVPPSASPSTRVISHIGLAGLEAPNIAGQPAHLPPCRELPAADAAAHTTHVEAEIEVRAVLRAGRGRAKRRHYPLAEDRQSSAEPPESNRSTNSPQSGVLSSREIVIMVDRKTGSLSIAHRKASVFCMNSLIVFILRRDRGFGIDSDDKLSLPYRQGQYVSLRQIAVDN